MKEPGDEVGLGDLVAHPMEPSIKWGRIVGIRKDDCKDIERVTIRLFQGADTWFPTGKYVTTALLVPYNPELFSESWR